MRNVSWPLRRWLVDRLVGQHAYSRNAFSITAEEATGTAILQAMATRRAQESAADMNDFAWTPEASGPIEARTFNGRGEQTNYRIFPALGTNSQEFTSDGIPLFDQERS